MNLIKTPIYQVNTMIGASDSKLKKYASHLSILTAVSDIFLLLTSDLHNFADDNALTGMSETIQNLVNILQDQTEKAVKMVNLLSRVIPSRSTSSVADRIIASNFPRLAVISDYVVKQQDS